MTTIVAARVSNIEIPLTTVFSTSNKTTSSSRLLMVNLEAENGDQGWGEAPLNATFTSESPHAAREAVEALIDEHVVGRDARAVAASLPELHRKLGTLVAARCALSMALWDLRGRLLQTPVYELLGGARRRHVPVVWHLGNFDVEQDARDAKEAVDQGFTILKLKVGRPDVNDDLQAVARVRETVGPGTRIYVDANQAWGRGQAAAFAAHAAELGVALIEQPLAKWDLAGLSQLSATPGVVVAGDESLFDAPQLLSALTGGVAPAGAVVKLLKAGGIEGAAALLSLCDLSRVQPFLAGMCGDSSLGSAALLHVAAATGTLPLGTAITPHFSREDVVESPLKVVDGHLRLDDVDGSGLGVEVDPDRVRALSV